MKAMLELEMPESCVVCPAGHGNPCGSGTYCKAAKQAFPESYSKQTERAPFCPLMPADTHRESREIDVGENGNIYCPTCKLKIGAYRWMSYCPYCGQKLDWGREYSE